MRAEDMGKLLTLGDRTRLPEAAPPTGLYLQSVFYELPQGLPPELAQASMLHKQEMLREAAEAAAVEDSDVVAADDAAGVSDAVTGSEQVVVGSQ